MAGTVAELRHSRHDVRFALGALEGADWALRSDTVLKDLSGAGKFQNLNALLESSPPGEASTG